MADPHPPASPQRVAVILIDTNTERWDATTTAIADSQALWSNAVVGNMPDPDGVFRSAAHYYREASNNTFDLSLVGNQTFGPFQLPDGWTDYFEWNAGQRYWAPRGNLWQAAVTAAQLAVDFDQVDTLIIITNTLATAPTTTTTVYSWPFASGVEATYLSVPSGAVRQRVIQCLTMPTEWERFDTSGRRAHETLCHELGHNLGFEDLYMGSDFDAAMITREIGGWDLMANENLLPHLSAWNKAQLGWIPPVAIKPYNFASSGGVDETVTLRATSALPNGGVLPTNEYAAIEVRRAEGWNYYFEYRIGQAGDIGDVLAFSPPRPHVLGTDTIVRDYSAPEKRKSIIQLLNDRDGDGAVLDAVGRDYKEYDYGGPAQFNVEVVSFGAQTAQVRVRYGAGGRPDPRIRPWPGGKNWQSPDIEIRTSLSDAEPKLLNIPIAGQENRVVARVANGGDFIATDVVTEFFIKDFSITGAPEHPIGSAVHTIAPQAVEEFQVSWTPPAETPVYGAHWCVIARIPLYQDLGNPAIVELDQRNNEAQSNYTFFLSAWASPSVRGKAEVSVSNAYPDRCRFWIMPQQSRDLYRTYIEHQWLWLDPGETRKVGVMFESLAGDPAYEEQFKRWGDKFYAETNMVSLIGLVERPVPNRSVHPIVTGGANIQVASGRMTEFAELAIDRYEACGSVVLAATRESVRGGKVIVIIHPDDDPMREVSRWETVNDRGHFAMKLDIGNPRAGEDEKKPLAARTWKMWARYLPAAGFADCISKSVWIDL